MRTSTAIPYFATVIVLAALFLGCKSSAPGTPPVPTPLQLQAANAVNSLAQSLDAAITAMQAARNLGKLSPGDVANAEKVAAIIATTGKQIDAELKSADPWTTQKGVILKIITTSGVQGAMQNLPANLAPYLAAALALFNQASSAAGGPTL